MRTSFFTLAAAAYMASQGQAIALEDNMVDLLNQDTLALAQISEDKEIAAIKANLEHTKTKKGVDLDPSYNEDRAVKQMKQAERAQKLGYKSVM